MRCTCSEEESGQTLGGGVGRLSSEGGTPAGHIMGAQPKALASKIPFQGGPMRNFKLPLLVILFQQ